MHKGGPVVEGGWEQPDRAVPLMLLSSTPEFPLHPSRSREGCLWKLCFLSKAEVVGWEQGTYEGAW